jgi:transposase
VRESRSLCEPFRQTITEKLAQELSAQRIYQDLTADHGYRGGYDSVKRFVNRLAGEITPWPMRRMECAPGFEAQVDFGTGAPVIGPDGKRRTTHVFRIVLSHSRAAYSEAVFRQTTEEFLRCLENAFWHFGGVPQTVVIDNLKAAVSHPDWYDPELTPKLRDFSLHYGTAILPTKPRTPRHKGKVERSVGYVKCNALKGHTFSCLADQNEHLAHWEQSVANTRIHGTTRQHEGQVFAEVERPALRRLPTERFPFFHEAERNVNRDGHVEVAKAYYSVPPEYLGRTVWVRWDARLVRVFNRRMEQIAVHVRHEQGRFSTQGQHIVAEKISGLERGARYLMNKVRLIGPSSTAWSEAMLTARGIEGTRVLLGLIALTKKHSSGVLESACKTALAHGEFRLRALRKLIGRQPELVQTALPFLEEHPLIRPLDDYARVVAAVAARKTPAIRTPDAPASVRFTRQGRANECADREGQSPERKSPGPGTAAMSGGQTNQGLRDIHPPGSGYSSPGCSPAEPGSASPDNSSLRPLLPPLPGENSHDE